MGGDPILARVAETLRGSTLRSPLARWMMSHHDEFAALLDEYGANWRALAEAFHADGLMPSGANPETAQRVWFRVRKRVEARKAEGPAVGSEGASDVPAPEPAATSGEALARVRTAMQSEGEDVERPRRSFATARLRGEGTGNQGGQDR